MKKHNKKLYINLSIILLFSIFFIITSFKKEGNLITTPYPLLLKEGAQNIPPKPKTENPPLPDQATPQDEQEGAKGGNSVTVLAGDTTTLLSFTPNTLFYNALVQAKNAGQIFFAGKKYPGLGFFVTDIGTLHTGDGKHLLYYVNGKEATVGVSLYTLKDGDTIEWKLE